MKLHFINCLENNLLVLFLELLFLYKLLHFSLSTQGALKASPDELCLFRLTVWNRLLHSWAREVSAAQVLQGCPRAG